MSWADGALHTSSPSSRGRAQCQDPHTLPVPTPPCKGQGWPYMARLPAAVFLLLQIPLIPPESSRRQAMTGEESYSRGAPLSAQPPRARGPPGQTCNIMGWVATETSGGDSCHSESSASPRDQQWTSWLCAEVCNEHTSPTAAGWHRSWRQHCVLSQPPGTFISTAALCQAPGLGTQVGRQQHSLAVGESTTPTLGVQFPREGIIFTE